MTDSRVATLRAASPGVFPLWFPPFSIPWSGSAGSTLDLIRVKHFSQNRAWVLLCAGQLGPARVALVTHLHT